MSIKNEIKPLLGILIILTIAVILDLTYDTIGRQAAENFDFSLWEWIIKLRPLLLSIVYTVFLIIGYPLLARDDSDHFLSWLLILIGLAAAYLMDVTPGGFSPTTRDLHNRLTTLLASQLGITKHSIAMLTALGIFRVLRYRFQKRS